MKVVEFELSQEELESLLNEYPNLGKNSHVGNLAVRIVELYFLSINPAATFAIGTDGADIEVHSKGESMRYEIKGTAAATISWSKLKVSSQQSYNSLVSGMELIRVTNIGNAKMKIHFLKFGVDFKLTPEARWAVSPISNEHTS